MSRTFTAPIPVTRGEPAATTKIVKIAGRKVLCVYFVHVDSVQIEGNKILYTQAFNILTFNAKYSIRHANKDVLEVSSDKPIENIKTISCDIPTLVGAYKSAGEEKFLQAVEQAFRAYSYATTAIQINNDAAKLQEKFQQ